jgi:CRP-like cAMP-binding protein
MVAVLDADPELAGGLSGSALAQARVQALAPTIAVGVGECDWTPHVHGGDGHLGLLVLEGLLTRREAVGELAYTEFLGVGDVLRPWCEESRTTLPTMARWEVIAPVRVACLDRDFALRVRQWPEIPARLLDRAVMRCRSLGVTLAIHRAVRLEERLSLMLWHLAGRWGHVTLEGTVLPIPLTHEALASLVGARRPPVSVALGKLRREGAVTRGAGGTWVLQPEALAVDTV